MELINYFQEKIEFRGRPLEQIRTPGNVGSGGLAPCRNFLDLPLNSKLGLNRTYMSEWGGSRAPVGTRAGTPKQFDWLRAVEKWRERGVWGSGPLSKIIMVGVIKSFIGRPLIIVVLKVLT